MTIKTPLKWVGSKARLMPQLLEYLPKGKRLVEPFGGSCAVMMNTDYDEYLIADVNPDLIGFYRAAAYHSEALIERAGFIFELAAAGGIPKRELFYYAIREEFNGKTIVQSVDRAARFLYLNRHCYGGVCRYNKRGHFNTPYGRYKKTYFPKAEILAFAEKARRATFICADFEETLRMVRLGDIVYCDPPYIPLNASTGFTGYHTDGFCDLSQEYLAGLLYSLSRKGTPVIVSNSDSQRSRSLYRLFTLHTLHARRSIGAAKGGNSSAAELLAVGILQ